MTHASLSVTLAPVACNDPKGVDAACKRLVKDGACCYKYQRYARKPTSSTKYFAGHSQAAPLSPRAKQGARKEFEPADTIVFLCSPLLYNAKRNWGHVSPLV